MAEAVEFSGANRRLLAPEGMDDLSCRTLPIFSNGRSCVSCWELSEDEVAEVVQTKRIFLSVMSGQTQPPVYVGGIEGTRELNADYGIWPK